MKHLVLAAASCFSYGDITTCSDGTAAIDFGNMRQIISPNGQNATVYQYGDMTLISPSTLDPLPENNFVDDNLLLPPLPDQSGFE